MKDASIKRYSVDELRQKAQAGESQTDFARIDAMSDDDVARAVATEPDEEGIPADWTERAEAVMPRPKVPVAIRLDADVVDFFRRTGPGWQTRINAVLKAYTTSRTAAAE